MKYTVIERSDGGVSINRGPDDEDVAMVVAAWEQDYSRPGEGHVPATAVRWLVVAEEPAPVDKTFRAAWALVGEAITVDMPKARTIHRGRLRVMRAPLLAALDVDYQRADERGDAAEKTRIAAEKQALRDVTDDPAIEAARTPEELKAVVPAPLLAGDLLGRQGRPEQIK
jgi:hypothetical protein